ncbi:MAG TPA: hypothetical protein VJP06_00525 [Thermoplasmata archaeon]|nr:hypothetical protein [Thermoplasmata archaeon]
MEAPPYVPTAPRRKMSRRKLLAIVAAVAILVGAVAAWQILRPRTIGEVLAMDHLRPGSEISVQGTVTAIGRENTSVGPRAYLQLDGNSFCGGPAAWTGNLLVDPNGTYRIGESYQTTLHVQDFSIEGEPAVWVPELACPFPALYRAIGVVIDAVSKVRDLPLVYNRTDAAGWSEYHIQVQNATGFDPNLMPVDLLKVLPLHRNRGPIDSANAWRDLADRVLSVEIERAGAQRARVFDCRPNGVALGVDLAQWNVAVRGREFERTGGLG